MGTDEPDIKPNFENEGGNQRKEEVQAGAELGQAQPKLGLNFN